MRTQIRSRAPPVRSITEAARQASELRLGQRLALTGPDDEFKQLADTFDVTLERVDAAFTSQKRFVANAAHELRTPLTAMRTAIEVTLSKPTRTPDQLEAMAVRVRRSVERAEATVEALLTLATSELGPAAHETIDLATAAEDALDAGPRDDRRAPDHGAGRTSAGARPRRWRDRRRSQRDDRRPPASRWWARNVGHDPGERWPVVRRWWLTADSLRRRPAGLRQPSMQCRATPMARRYPPGSRRISERSEASARAFQLEILQAIWRSGRSWRAPRSAVALGRLGTDGLRVLVGMRLARALGASRCMWDVADRNRLPRVRVTGVRTPVVRIGPLRRVRLADRRVEHVVRLVGKLWRDVAPRHARLRGLGRWRRHRCVTRALLLSFGAPGASGAIL